MNMKKVVNSVYPEVEPSSDKAYRLSEAAASLIPCGSSVFKSLFSSPHEKRLEVWIDAVTEAINELIEVHHKEFIELQGNEQFVDFVLGLSTTAVRSSCTHKMQYLKTAIIHSAIHPMDSKDEYLFYLSLLDSFSAAKIRVLSLVGTENGVILQGYDHYEILKQFSDYEEKCPIYKYALNSLLSDELVSVSHAEQGCVYRLSLVGQSLLRLVEK